MSTGVTEVQMKMGWLNLYGGGTLSDSLQHVFSRQAENKARRALDALEARFGERFDGQAWLGQQGFSQIAIGVEIRIPKAGSRRRRFVAVEGSQLIVEVSFIYPHLEADSQLEVEAVLEPIVMEAFVLAADRKALGPLPERGHGRSLPSMAQRPAGSELLFFYDEPGDCYIIARQLPQTDDPAEISSAIEQYESDIRLLLSDDVLKRPIDVETTLTEVRWIVPMPSSED
jgi:hypothetical protein